MPAPSYVRGSRRARRARNRRLRRVSRRGRSRRSLRRRRGRRSVARAPLLPKRSKDAGPIQIVVSLKKQRMTVYESGQPVGSSRVSTGMRGFDTPSGIFSILQKRRRHYSNIYRGAPMPFMQRLTWSGIALHQGVVPGYRASHGCIRLPGRFARDLFRYTERRSHVIVVDGDPRPQPIEHDELFQPSLPMEEYLIGSDNSKASSVEVAQDAGSGERASDSNGSGVLALLRQAVAGSPAVAQPAPTLDMFHDIDEQDLIAHRQLQRAFRSTAPLRILITRKSTRDHVRDAQLMLVQLGYDAGFADGLIGKQTVAAIKAFQKASGLPATGYPNEKFHEALRRKAGHEFNNEAFLYVRQNARDIYSAAVGLKDPQKPLGTHLYTVNSLGESGKRAYWHGMTIRARGRLPGQRRSREAREKVEAMTVHDALDRIVIPPHVRMRIEDLLTPETSLIIADTGHTRETGQDTDFIVLTK
ncbi:MAG: L,D-transpeptidase family protein [Hyphomicrobiaceae bacterium]